MRFRPWAWAVLVLASAGPFVLGLGFEHVYDDHYTLVTTPALALPPGELLATLLRGDGRFPDVSRPAMVLSAYLDQLLWGSSPSGTHLTSLLLYVASTFAAAALAFAILRRRRPALVAAVLWAAMPIHAEAVVCASYREDLFATLGVLGALGILVAPARSPHSWRRAAAAGALFSLGLAGKESGLCLVPLLVLLGPPLGERGTSLSAWAARRERSLIVCGLALATYAAWRFGLAITGDGVARAAGWGAPHDDARYVLWAATRSLWPVEVEPVYAALPAASPLWWLPLALAALAVVRWRSTPVGRAMALLFAGALLTAPFVGPANVRADRYLLVTTLGAACLASLALEEAARALRARSSGAAERARIARGHALVVGVLGLLLGARSMVASQVWSTDLALWSHATERVPESAKAWQGLAWAERRAGRLDDAERSLARSLALDPARPETRLSLAYLALLRHDVPLARQTLEALRDEGHDELRGMRRAWHCAFDVPDPEVVSCVGEWHR